MRVIGKIVAAIIFSIVGFLAGTPLFASFGVADAASDTGSYLGIALFLSVFAIIMFAPTVRRAFGRGFLLSGLLIFALPLSVLILSGTAASSVISDTAAAGADEASQAAAALGASLGAGLLTGFASFVGFILGSIFIITGLVLTLGGRREVVVVNVPGQAA